MYSFEYISTNRENNRRTYLLKIERSF